ncbi:MAG: ATP-binding cassette domain-containing protein [Sedimentisphaerales bacterium]|nr:ATP-binding cassette domain-containing protein [Sedimentisphaerales bacterium]
MEPETHIRVKNLNVYYGKDHVLRDVSINIPDKRVIVIIGPSGCGKTTLLRSFNRLVDTVDGVRVSGEVMVDEENIFDPHVELTHIRKKMGLLSQTPYPLPMSIYDNVAYGPRLHGIKDKKKLNSVVEHYLKIAGLWEEVKDKLHTPATQVSIGQQQRLCLARGLAVEPEIILADEPTSALDPKSSRHIEESFLRLKKDYTIIVVTHILRQARRLADYVIFLYCGELIEHGPARQVFESPREKMTREYIQGVIS